jgi:hypothetical protein
MGRLADFFKEQSVPLAGQQKQKMLSLDREFEEMKAERDALKTENLHLKAQVNPLQRDIERLKDQIKQLEKEGATADEQPLDEKAQALLLAIAQRFHVSDGGGEAIIKGTRALAAYYLGFLKERRLIRYIAANYTVDGRYVATQEGLEYLHKAGKL